MNEIENELNVEQKPTMTAQDYISAINEVKASMVSKEDYDKVVEDNKILINTLKDGNYQPQEEVVVEEVDIDQLRKELYSGKEISNLEYWTKTLQLRDAIIKTGNKDPFLPYGSKVAPTRDDMECAERVASIVKECIDIAEGDSDIFTRELNKRTID